MRYTRFILSNGLTVIHHPDENTQLAVLNILYKVGSKDEDPIKTGFAHLFEHLMFGGSIHIPEYDTPLQEAGGDNNAFTSNDITNYYLSLPKDNIETGFWLESDRMLSLDFSEQSLNVQRGVVIEEFKERYLNQPYGDAWHHLLPLAYTVHPYSWPTIGKNISHIENATLHDVKDFFARYYCPNNAILVVAGNISLEQTQALCKKWFEPIPPRQINRYSYTAEPTQTSARETKIDADVPFDMLIKAWHTCGRMQPDFFATDLLSDHLGAGRSALLYNELVKKQGLFAELDCYITGDVEPGLLVVEGKLRQGVSLQQANQAVEKIVYDVAQKGISDVQLQKLKNKAETNIQFSDMKLLNRAMKLAYAEFMGDISLAENESSKYLSVSLADIARVAKDVLSAQNCSTLYYQSTQLKNGNHQ
jgi:zinc protease